MFATFNLSSFGRMIKELRKSLGHSQEDVYNSTGISLDAQRKIENGRSIPRFDTLVLLSGYFKMDLLQALNHHKKSNELFELYNRIDHVLCFADVEALHSLIEDVDHQIKTETFSPVNLNERRQFQLFLNGFQQYYAQQHEVALKTMVEALTATNSSFTLDIWSQFKYTFFELRILYAIASILGMSQNCHLSNDIILYVLKCLQISTTSDYNQVLIPKAYTLLAYNYHRLDLHDKALETAVSGIDFTIRTSTIQLLPPLYVRKGIAEYFLGMPTHVSSLKNAVHALQMLGKTETAEEYTKLFASQYGISLF